MRNPLTPRYDEHAWDRVVSVTLLALGAAFILMGSGDQYRVGFSGLAFLVSLMFVAVYSRYDWRTTYAGRATMIAMSVTVIYTSHATLILIWPYPHWETTQALIYLLVAYAAVYKLRALTRRTDPRAVNDPTTDRT